MKRSFLWNSAEEQSAFYRARELTLDEVRRMDPVALYERLIGAPPCEVCGPPTTLTQVELSVIKRGADDDTTRRYNQLRHVRGAYMNRRMHAGRVVFADTTVAKSTAQLVRRRGGVIEDWVPTGKRSRRDDHQLRVLDCALSDAQSARLECYHLKSAWYLTRAIDATLAARRGVPWWDAFRIAAEIDQARRGLVYSSAEFKWPDDSTMLDAVLRAVAGLNDEIEKRLGWVST